MFKDYVHNMSKYVKTGGTLSCLTNIIPNNMFALKNVSIYFYCYFQIEHIFAKSHQWIFASLYSEDLA